MCQSHDFEYAPPPRRDSQAGFTGGRRHAPPITRCEPSRVRPVNWPSPERFTPGSRTSTEEQHVARVVVEVMPKAEILDPPGTGNCRGGTVSPGLCRNIRCPSGQAVRVGDRRQCRRRRTREDRRRPAGQHGDRGLDRQASRGMSARIGVITFPRHARRHRRGAGSEPGRR